MYDKVIFLDMDGVINNSTKKMLTKDIFIKVADKLKERDDY